ncbi:zinc-dependent metalloprotease [Novosphingobium album (ex Liu et al. 2023)]|uniref:Zinc-dependent metalloprotease n=1 Tax=Novosphingobium album (ex Liu et al. 2023) TaxID=3031130 RepID=A0ABT5WR19_9SPHN|nr:zinc-dependent metalloprotease [Novosphingobium album (ex Liu et al. 2023)]MDE8652473.1 zinc-dependent metalloprotease [Novosphingobium album (ex Liu et al. 2023)]
MTLIPRRPAKRHIPLRHSLLLASAIGAGLLVSFPAVAAEQACVKKEVCIEAGDTILLHVARSRLGEDLIWIREPSEEVRYIKMEEVGAESGKPELRLTIDPDEADYDDLPGYAPSSHLPRGISQPNLFDASGPLAPSNLVDGYVFDITALLKGDRTEGADLGAVKSDSLKLASLRAFGETVLVGLNASYEIKNSPGKQGNFTTYWSFRLPPAEAMEAQPYNEKMGGYSAIDNRRKTGRRPANVVKFRLSAADVAKGTPVIRFYLDPAIPLALKPAVVEGILAWNKAFIPLGIDHAIEVREMPPGESWPEFRTSVSALIWGPIDRSANLATGGGTARHVIDRRSGEILKADVFVDGPFFDGLRQFFAVAPRKLEGTDYLDVTGPIHLALLRRLTGHEVGHGIGLRDGNYGIGTYSVAARSDPQWLGKMGFTPSIMNYEEYNRLIEASPAPNFPLDYLIAGVGPGDVHQIGLSYMIADGLTRAQRIERIQLAARAQIDQPWLRFIGQDFLHAVPTKIADYDDTKALEVAWAKTSDGLAVLGRDAARGSIDPATAALLYKELQSSFSVTLMKHIDIVGATEKGYTEAAWPNPVYQPVAVERQRRLVGYVASNLSRFSESFLEGAPPTIKTSIMLGAANAVGQTALLSLLDGNRIFALEKAMVLGKMAYPVGVYLQDIREGLLGAGRCPTLSETQKQLRQSYVDVLDLLAKRASTTVQMAIDKEMGVLKRQAACGDER